MRTPLIAFAVMAAGGCASDAQSVKPYDDVAEIVGAQVATARGGGELIALVDATMIARSPHQKGNIVIHDGIPYEYDFACPELSPLPAGTCGFADRADVSVLWGGRLETARFAAATAGKITWQINGLSGSHAWVVGSAMSWFDATFASGASDEQPILVQTFKDVAFAWDPSSMTVLAGSESASIKTIQGEERTELTGDVVFDRADRATLTLDDRVYWIDPTTGTTTVATNGELY